MLRCTLCSKEIKDGRCPCGASNKEQESMQKAYEMIHNLIGEHPEISGKVWGSALWGLLVSGYEASILGYEQFEKDWRTAKAHYRSWFEEKN